MVVVLTTYNPAMLALNDMMKQQIDLSRQFLDMQRDMHKNIMGNIEKEHYYTTLEETKQVMHLVVLMSARVSHICGWIIEDL